MQTSIFPTNTFTENIPTEITNFGIWLRRNGKAEQTIRAYCGAARHFFSLYPDLTQDHLRLYKCYLIDHYRPNTVNLRIRAINSFLEFSAFSCTKIPMVRIQQKTFLENVISPADYEYLKRCLLRDGKLGYYFAVRIMAATGVRISELVQIQTEDIRRGQFDLCSKGSKIRRIYIPKQVQGPCLLWLKNEQITKGPIFLNRFGRPISVSGIRGQLKVFALRYNLDPAVVHPHAFRHLFAKNFVERCSDLALLSDILGHENIETTRVYLHKSSTEQQHLFNQIVTW